MKTILIFHSNQQSIAEIQSILTGHCYVYATSQPTTVQEFLEKNPVDSLVIYLPAEPNSSMKNESVKLLRKLNIKAYQDLLKIVFCSNKEEQQVKNFIGLGVTAIVASEMGLKLVLGI